jgi:hypothetical protein
VSSVGFFEKEVPVSDYRIRDNAQINVVLKESILILPDMTVVTTDAFKRGSVRLGGFSYVSRCRVSITQKVVDTVVNIIKPSKIKIYPNPISKNQLLTLEIKTERRIPGQFV